jgi:hypothetical protein
MAALTKAHCNTCLRMTNHQIVGQKKTHYDDDSIVEVHEYEIVVCQGCDTVRFRQVTSGSEITDREGRHIDEITYYPPAISRQRPPWLGSVDFRINHEEIAALLDEVYAALHNDLKVLATIGIRTVIDKVITDKIGDVGDFPSKLNTFAEAGLISATNKAFVLQTIDAGSASAHRGFRPSTEDLGLLIDVTEVLISSIYVLPKAIDRIAKKVPPRPPRKATANFVSKGKTS